MSIQGIYLLRKRDLCQEKLFERFCEGSGKMKWFYKNGDKGSEYFSIVYTDNFGNKNPFTPIMWLAQWWRYWL